MTAKKDSSQNTAPAEKKNAKSYFAAVGKRKSAVAQVRLFPQGKGSIMVNDRKVEEYFPGIFLEKLIVPLKVLSMSKSFDVSVHVQGGGYVGQADAICHGIAKALSLVDEGSRTTLKRAGLLTRDSRVKERKKYGLKKARRAPQWSKR